MTYVSSIKQNVASVDENPNLDGCVNSCKKKNTSPVVPIVASVGGLFVLSLIVAAILLELRRRRNINRDKPGGHYFKFKIQLIVNHEENIQSFM